MDLETIFNLIIEYESDKMRSTGAYLTISGRLAIADFVEWLCEHKDLEILLEEQRRFNER